MQMERERRINGNANGIYSQFCMDEEEEDASEVVDRVICSRDNNGNCAKLLPVSFSSPCPSSSSSPINFIEHPVSKFDTLAGVAIKYGVEVADIKKMNGLVTDLQMFALKTLHIPLPGRHPPSPCLSNGSDATGQNSSGGRHDDLLESFHSLRGNSPRQQVSPAMSSLQGYYGLKPTDQKLKEDASLTTFLTITNSRLNRHRKSKSYANCILDENGERFDNLPIADAGEVDSDKWNEKLVRRRQKSETDFNSHSNSRTPEKLLREENSGTSMISSITGKGLAQRPKAASRTSLAADSETGGLNTGSLADSYVVDGFPGVKKSSSTSSLQDQDSNSPSSIWSASKLKLKSDFQALSTAAIARPIFDGLPKPITGRKNKAALD